MRNFSLKTKSSSSRKPGALITPKLAFVGVVFGILFFFQDLLGGVSSIVVSPFIALQHYFETSSAAVPVYIRERTSLLNTIQSLEQQIAAKEGMRITLEYIEKENAELRALMTQATSTPTLLAGVVARPPYSPYDSLVIDQGEQDGVVENAPVYYGSGRTLGYVRKVFDNYALVTLLSSPEVESTVYVFGANVFTTAYGEGGGVIRLSIPQGVRVTEGDVVVLPSLDGGVVGAVSSVQSIPTEPEQHAYVVLEVPMQSIRVVRVALTPHEVPSLEGVLDIMSKTKERLFITQVPAHFETSTTTGTSSAESL